METSAFGTSNLSSRSLKIDKVYTTQNEENCLKFTNPLRDEFPNFTMGLGPSKLRSHVQGIVGFRLFKPHILEPKVSNREPEMVVCIPVMEASALGWVSSKT